MSAYDRFIDNATLRLDLGHRTRWVVDVLAGWMVSHPLGLDGLQQQFEQAGLGARFQSWQRPGQTLLPVVASELERALGAPTMTSLAHRCGMSPGAFRVIACDLLPGLVNLMGPQTTGLPLGRKLHPPRHGRSGPGRRMGSMVPSRAMHGMALRGLLWVLAVVAVLGLTTWLLLIARTPLWTAQSITREIDARLVLQQVGTQVHVQGSLPSEAERRRVWNALAALHGRQNLHGGIALDPRVQSPRWLDRLLRDLPQLQGPGLRLAFAGDQLQIDSTALPDLERRAISRQVRQDFPALQIDGLWGPGLAALSQLPDSADTAQRVAALNLTTLKFHAGSTQLTGDSRETVRLAAAALRTAPPGTKMEIAAHTDNQGPDEHNRLLSQQRAEAVAQALQVHGVPASMLVPVGYGSDHPIADNRSESGRQQNRRVAYQVLDAPR